MGIIQRPSAGEGDFEGLIALFRAEVAVDGGDFSIDDVRAEYVDDEPGWLRSHTVWEDDATGELVALAAIWHEPGDAMDRAYGSLAVHPDHRNHGFEDEVMGAFISGGEGIIDRQVALRVGTPVERTALRGMLERAGFTDDRHFYRMTRDLSQPIPEPAIPDGYTVKALQDSEVEAWVDLLDVAFAEHYDQPRLRPDERRKAMEQPDYRAHSDLVAVAPDGAFAGMGWALVEALDNGTHRGWIRDIAVHPDHRGKGLARALLLMDLQLLRDEGLATASLGVDVGNETGALRLYEQCGFTVSKEYAIYLRQIGG